MKAIRPSWFGLLAALAGCGLVAGCLGTGRHPANMPAPREEASRLNDAQKADLQFAFARSLEKNGTFEQVTAAYQDVLKKDPHCADALDRLAVLNAKKGHFDQAVALSKKALALQPRNVDFVCNLGYCYYLQQRWAEAEIQFRKAIDLAPQHSRALNNLGLVLAHSHRSEESLSAFRRGGCSEADAHSNLAFVLTLESSWKEAQQHYVLAHKLDPASGPAEKGLRVVNARIEGSEKLDPASVPANKGLRVVNARIEGSEKSIKNVSGEAPAVPVVFKAAPESKAPAAVPLVLEITAPPEAPMSAGRPLPTLETSEPAPPAPSSGSVPAGPAPFAIQQYVPASSPHVRVIPSAASLPFQPDNGAEASASGRPGFVTIDGPAAPNRTPTPFEQILGTRGMPARKSPSSNR